MKYQIPFLIISVLVIYSFSFYDAYASGPLSFDQTNIIIDHSGIISCIGCTDVGPTISVTLNGGSSGTKSITLSKVLNSSPLTYSSNFIKFTDCTTCGSLEYDVIPGNVITATASGYTTTSPATIFQTEASLDNNASKYGKSYKTIAPWSYGICNNYHGDTDGDYICDDWEDSSVVTFPSACTTPASNPVGKGLCIRTSATSKIYYLSCNDNDPSNKCPSKDKSDFYVEIDWMKGHKPTTDVISAVADTFANSNYVSKNSVPGITFHYQLDEELPHVNSIPWIGSITSPGFDQLKYWWFGTASERTYSVFNENLASDWIDNNNSGNKRSEKGQVFHYVIFAHFYSEDTNSSGNAEKKGNDVMITLGNFTGKVGSKDQQKGTLLHEIGHNLGLDHGGKDSIGCKPNYLSVMSYTRQSTDLINNRPLDFSRSALPTLNELSLNEPNGVGASSPTGLMTIYGPGNGTVTNTGIPVDWNRDGDTADTGVSNDINFFYLISKCPQSTGQSLTGSFDWDSSLRLTPLGIIGTGEEDSAGYPDPATIQYDDLSVLNDTKHKKLLDESSSSDITSMRVARIDFLINSLKNIPVSNITANGTEINNVYQELDEVKADVMNNNSDNNTLVNAYDKMIKFQNRLDGRGTDEIICDYTTRDQILNETYDIVLSQSTALQAQPPAKITNNPGDCEKYKEPSSPRKQMKDRVAPKDVICKSGLTLIIRISGDAACVKSHTFERLTALGWGKSVEKESRNS